MSEVEVRPDMDLNELLQQDIPCRDCGKAAQLRSFGHGCRLRNKQPPYYKCTRRWQRWLLDEVLPWIAEGGFDFRCGRKFTTPESFSDYRPF